jgi:hypothetical protein
VTGNAAESAEAQSDTRTAPSGVSADPAAQAEGGDEAEGEASGEAGAEARPEAAAGERPILRLRSRRRRRRRPHAPGLLPGPLVAPDSAAGSPEAPGPLVAPDGAAATTSSGATATTAGQPAPAGEPGARPARPRNRRRRRTPPGDAAAGHTGGFGPREAGAPSGPRTRPGERRPGAGRQGERRPQGERSDGARQGASREPRRDAGPGGDPRGDAGPSGDPRGDQREPRRDPGRDGARNRPPGRGRDAPPRRTERQLYSVDSVVDRGFEDVEEEAGTRRVHWTIVKRTTADQISRKPVSAVYVLQRDGADSEFPNLGTARSAVNKTIVHPEKLTRSKAEIAAEKK